MVLKGCTKRVVVVKNTESDLFEEAVFFLKAGKECLQDKDFVSEANNLIARQTIFSERNQNISRKKNIRRKSNDFFLFVTGIAVGVCLMLILF